MTTAHPTTGSGRTLLVVGPVVRGAFLTSFALGVVALVVAALVQGTPAVLGAAIGLALVWGYFGFGALVVAAVSAVASPAVTLLVSLLTYLLQVLLAGVVFVVVSRSALLERSVDARWLAGAVIVGTLVWVTGQIVGTMRQRIPAYDLPPQQASEATEANVR
jgi:ATP synthase protein I